MANRRIVVEFLGDDKSLSKTAKSVDGSTSKLDARFKKVGLAAAAGFGVAGAAAIKFTGDAAALERKQREVVTLFGETGDVAEKSLKGIQDQVRRLSDEFGIAQTTVTDGLYQAISAGVPRENALEFMRVASKAATAGVTDVETSVDGLTSIINAFGLEAKDAQAVSDSMFTAVKDGKTNFTELSDSIFQIAPAAAAAGVSFKEVNAGIATLTAGGTPTKIAATQMRAALVGLQKPSEALDKVFQDIGYESGQVAIEQKGLGFALDAVKEASGGNNGELQKLLGSVEAVAAANVIAGTGADKFAKSMKNQADSAGATGDAYDVMAESASVKFEKLQTRLQNIGLEIGTKLLPVAIELTDWVGDELLPGVSKASAFLSATFGPAFAKIGAVVKKVTGGMRGDVGSSLSSIQSIFTSVVTAATYLWNQFGSTIVAYTRSSLANIRQAFSGVLKVISGILQVFSSLLKGDWKGMWDGVKKIASGAFIYLSALVKQGWNVIKTLFKVGGKAAKLIFSAMWDGIKALARRGVDSVVNGIKALPGKLRGLRGIFRSAGKFLIDGFVSGMKNAAGVIQGIAGNVWTAVKSMLNRAIDTINQKIPNSIGPGGVVDLPDNPFPKFFRGGIVPGSASGTPIIAGDRGNAEAIIPLEGPYAPKFGTLGRGGGDDRRPIIVKLYLDGKVIHQSLVKRKRVTGQALGLA